MPIIQITMLAGRTTEQKRKSAERMTAVMIDQAGVKPEAVVVAFYEVTKESYARAGVLLSDR
jgi:4-oxalocrotonate tautomerase